MQREKGETFVNLLGAINCEAYKTKKAKKERPKRKKAKKKDKQDKKTKREIVQKRGKEVFDEDGLLPFETRSEPGFEQTYDLDLE